VLGIVTGGLTLLMSIFFLAMLVEDAGDPPNATLLLGLPCAIGMIIGGLRLLSRRPPVLLFASALAAVLVLLITLLTGLVTLFDPGEMFGLVVLLLLAAPLPVVTAVLSWRPVVAGWVAAAA
jgi:hypothetical protein